MKLRKSIFSFIALFIIICSNFLYAQLNTTATGMQIKSAGKQIYPDNTFSYYSFQGYAFGVDIGDQNNATIIGRSVWYFDVPATIPSGSQVYKVELTYRTYNNKGFYVTYISSLTDNPDYQQAWEAAGNGSSIGSFAGSSNALYTYDVSSSLNSIVQSAVNSTSKRVKVGIMASTELMDVSTTTMYDLQIKIYYNRAINLTVSNNFNAGSLKVNGGDVSSGSTVPTYETITNTLEAKEPQSNNGINYLWNDTEGATNKSSWDRKKGITTIGKGNTQSISQTAVYADNGAEYVANMRLYYNVNFQNSFTGGTITVAGTSSSSPATTQVVEGNSVTATAQQLFENFNSSGLDYIFSSWEDGSTSLSKTFTVNSTETHTASYTRRANTSLCFAFSFANVAIGNDIQLTWAEHPNTNATQYKIWRRVKNGSEGYIGTVNRGTTSFTDYEYQYASESDPDKETLYYNVYVYCSLDGGTWNGDGMKLVTGVGGLMKENLAAHTNITLPTEYKIDNYPNPFNPTTTINFQLPEAGMVTLRVYDILGQEVATLVNEMKQAGYYSATFDASKLTSGIYISTIQTNNFSQSKKMLLVK
jgi:hypothetical protein